MVWFLGQEDALEKGMATHSSILAWTIPWAEEPGGLQCIGSQSQTWLKQQSTCVHAHTHTHTHTHTNTTLEKEGKIAKEKDLDSRNQRDIKLVGTGRCAPKMCAHLSQKPQASLGLSIPSQIIPIRSDPQYICRIKEGSQDLTLPPRKQVFPLPLYFHKHATDPMVCEGGELEFTVSCWLKQNQAGGAVAGSSVGSGVSLRSPQRPCTGLPGAGDGNSQDPKAAPIPRLCSFRSLRNTGHVKSSQ